MKCSIITCKKEAMQGSKRCHRCTETRRKYRTKNLEELRVTERIAERKRYDPNKSRNKQLKRKFKLTSEQWELIFESQGRCCAACKSEKPGVAWCTDHDHACCSGSQTCGRCFRGILCQDCNVALGRVKDSISRLQNLICYLNDHSVLNVV